MLKSFIVVAAAALLASCGPPVVVATPIPTTRPNISGNWLVAVENPTDGTFRRTYFTLEQTGDQISGTIRTPNSRIAINESTWDSTGFVITNVQRNGTNERRTTYDGRLVGNELHLRRRAAANAQTPPPELVAHRVAASEGALPAKISLP